MAEKRGQIWVETVIYTLIGLAIIGILLSILKPVIEEKKDQLIIEQSLDLLNAIDATIEDVRYYGVGNSREMEIQIKKGELVINSEQDYIEFFMRSKYKYSELNQTIEVGKIMAKTEEKAEGYEVFLSLNYSSKLNLTFNSKEEEKIFHPSSVPYKIIILNNRTIDFS